jgi:gamma-glutamylputrescine oxidase
LIKNFNYSYWELKRYFNLYDLIIIGSGIVGLSAAISFKEKHRKAKILILEKGILPDGASTKNAGFACFGSAGELLDDLGKMTEKNVWETVSMRYEGLQLLRSRLKDKNIDFRLHGGFELFDKKLEYDSCIEKLAYLNSQMRYHLKIKKCYRVLPIKKTPFKKIKGVILNAFEGQIDTSLMMSNLLKLAHKNEIDILNNVEIKTIKDLGSWVELYSNAGVFKSSKVIVATNGFTQHLLKIKDVKPARAQVLITKPIKDLKIKGAFHFQQGYYYFRNINDRLLLGGGRNLDFEGETTSKQGLNIPIQEALDKLLNEMILPDTPFVVEHRWSGIMGMGKEKKPIIRAASKNVLVAVRMGGMGIAIGSWAGEKAASEIS